MKNIKTIGNRDRGELALRNLSKQAQTYYKGTDPLTVYEYDVDYPYDVVLLVNHNPDLDPAPDAWEIWDQNSHDRDNEVFKEALEKVDVKYFKEKFKKIEDDFEAYKEEHGLDETTALCDVKEFADRWVENEDELGNMIETTPLTRYAVDFHGGGWDEDLTFRELEGMFEELYYDTYKITWLLFEDNAGGLTVVVFDREDHEKITYIHSGYEYEDPSCCADGKTELQQNIEALLLGDDPARDWDNNLLDEILFTEEAPDEPTNIEAWFPIEDRHLGWDVVAEGDEDGDIWIYPRRMGCAAREELGIAEDDNRECISWRDYNYEQKKGLTKDENGVDGISESKPDPFDRLSVPKHDNVGPVL